MELKQSLRNDYSNQAHPKIQKAIYEASGVSDDCYGMDKITTSVVERIKDLIGNPEAEVFFVSSGTMANRLILDSILMPSEAVIATKMSHINTFEAGGTERGGHKVLTVDTKFSDGKFYPKELEEVQGLLSIPHSVIPKVVHVSNTNERGVPLGIHDFECLCRYCNEKGLYLTVDGARLGVALAEGYGTTFETLGSKCDAFSIGGTKNGGFVGEAVVVNNPAMKERFQATLKSYGELISRTRFYSSQFLTLFEEDPESGEEILFLNLARKANNMAMLLSTHLEEEYLFKMLVPCYTNLLFPIFPNRLLKKLQEQYALCVIEKVNMNQTAVRLATSWSTKEETINDFLEVLRKSIKEVYGSKGSLRYLRSDIDDEAA